MKENIYLLDTHAFYSWVTREGESENFIRFFDDKNQNGSLYVSSIVFWEIALLVKVGRIKLFNILKWKDEITCHARLNMINPDASQMILSTLLPDHHKDPFDRILIAQAKDLGASLVTKDKTINKYPVKTFWLIED